MVRTFWLLVVALGSLASAAAAPTTLDPTETRIVAAVDRGAPAALELIERTVDINSGTLNLDGVRATGRAFAPEFEALGFATRWVEGADWGRAGHLVGERPGRGRGPRILLIGHLDTVFEQDSPFQRFERLDDSTASGPGVIDMKGGIAVMLLALRSLSEARALDRLSIKVILMGDEEKPGTPLDLARRDLVTLADWAEVAIGFEDGAGDPRTAVIARRGASSWVLRAAGKPAHSSQIFRHDIGDGSIYEVARILHAFHDSLSREPYLTVNPGIVLGGTDVEFQPDQSRGTAFGKNNVIAESTAVSGDLRSISIEQREAAKARMRRIVESHLPHTSAQIEFDDGYPPLPPSDGNRRLLEIYDQASRDVGAGAVAAVDPARAGAADISFTQGRVEMALDGVGLMGDGGHTIGETADLRTLPSQAKRMALTLWRLARDPKWSRR